MRELVTVLLGFEELARDLYATAETYFAHDDEFARLMGSLAEHESHHAEAMRRAVAIVDDMQCPPVKAFQLAGKRPPGVGDRVCDTLEKMRTGFLEKQGMIDCALDLEMSEWNDFFRYVVDVLKEQDREFQHMASEMQLHKEEVLRLSRMSGDAVASSHPLAEVPPVWTRRTLVVDDEPAITNMLTRVLRGRTVVEAARDGREAIEKLRQNYYDAVISDVAMPRVNGLQLLRSAVEIDPNIGERLLFLTATANLPEELSKSLSERGISVLDKPASIASIRERLDKILGRKAS